MSLLSVHFLIFSFSIGSGGWISDGVRTVQSTRSSQGRTTVQCESTHLTSFAVLVDITGVRTCMPWETGIDYECLLSPTPCKPLIIILLKSRLSMYMLQYVFMHWSMLTAWHNVYHNQFLGKFSAGGFESCFLHWMCYITCLSDYSHHFLLVPQVRLTCICHIHCIVCCSYYILHTGRNSSSQVQCALFISILLYHSFWLIWRLQLELK